MTGERTYLIRNHPPRFWTGKTADGRQILAGPMTPHFVVYHFSIDGRFEERELVSLVKPLVWDDTESRYIPRPGYSRELQAEAAVLLERLGAIEATVEILSYFDEEMCIGIQDLPSEYIACLEDHAFADNEEEAADFRESIDKWARQGGFDFIWGVELWMNDDGKLVAS